MLNQQLILGSTYRIKFKGAFERHGVCTTSGFTCLHKGNGVFRLEQISTFRDIVLAGIKLYDIFFAPLGISKEEYEAYFSDKPADTYAPEYTQKTVTVTTKEQVTTTDPVTGQVYLKEHEILNGHEVFVESGKSIITRHAEDSVSYGQYPIYKFVDVVDSTDILYVPELTIDGFPEIDIKPYKDLNLVFHLGYYDKPQLLDAMLLAIRERMATYGIQPSNIKMYSTGTKWMNQDEYERLKSIRLPVNIENIPADASIEDYLGKSVIQNGLLKRIVENVQPGQNSSQVAFETLKTKPLVIDADLFMEEVTPSMTFDSAKTYYEKISYTIGSKSYSDCLRKLREDEVRPGEKILVPEAYSASQMEHPETKTAPYYRKVMGDYVRIGKQETRDNTHGYEETYIPGETVLPHPEEWYYWVKTTKIVDRGAVTKIYVPAKKTQIEDTQQILYKKLVDQYVTVSEDQKATATHTSQGSKRYYYENYLSRDSLACIGNVFMFENAYAQDKSMTLQMVDIINFGMQEQKKNMILIFAGEMGTGGVPNDLLRSRWAKWAGRYLQIDAQITNPVTSVVETVPLMVKIPSAPTTDFLGISGSIMGQNGTLAKDVNMVSDTSLKRNYYMQYILCKTELEQLQQRHAALEEYVRAMAIPAATTP